MSAETETLDEAIKEGLQELLAAPTPTRIESEEEHVYRRRRKGENYRPTPLQVRYQRQLRDVRAHNPELVEDMSRLVAWTWLPGRDRKVCPPVVDIRDARLLVMDRFPLEPGGPASQIALAMYRSVVTSQGVVNHGTLGRTEMFKDFAIRPHFRAGGLCLDSRNEQVFQTGLALDQAMELVARGKLDPVSDFRPPKCLFGFPQHFTPAPEWRAPMQEQVLGVFQPEHTVLRCLLSPGGRVTSITEFGDHFRGINVEHDNTLVQLRIPDWVPLTEAGQVGIISAEGVPLADLPRGAYTSIKDITDKYPFQALEWLERRLMDELSEIVVIDDEVFDKQTGRRVPLQTTWRAVPSEFVQTQVNRAVRYFLDMRQHLGRKRYSMDSFERDVWSTNENQVRIDVMQFDHRPFVVDLQFTAGYSEKNITWRADLLSTPPDAAWASRVAYRGQDYTADYAMAA